MRTYRSRQIASEQLCRLYTEFCKLELTRDDIIGEIEAICSQFPELETPTLSCVIRVRPDSLDYPGREI